MYPAAPVAGAGSLTPVRDEEGGSTPVLDEPDDDDIADIPNYSTPMVLGDEGKSVLQPNMSGGPPPQAGNPEFAYRIMHLNDGVASSQLPGENGGMSAPPPGSFGPDGAVVYRTDIVDGFQSASEAFHPPPDFFRSETDFSVPPPMTIYQVKDEGFGPASESVPVFSSARDMVYTVVTTVQQPPPTSYYPVVIEVPTFAEPPHKLSTLPPPPVSFVRPPVIFDPSLPPPTLPPSNLSLPTLPPPPAPPQPPPLPQPISLHYTGPPPANIQVVVAPHTLKSPLPAPPKSAGPPPVYVPQQSSSNLSLVSAIRTLPSSRNDEKATTTHSYRPQSVLKSIRHIRDDENTTTPSYWHESVFQGTRHIRDDEKTTTTTSYRPESVFQGTRHSRDDEKTTTTPSYRPESVFQGSRHIRDDEKTTTTTSYRPESVLQGIRHIRDSHQKASSTSVVSVIPTIGTGGSGGEQSQIQQKPMLQKLIRITPAPEKSPVADRHITPLLSLNQPEEVMQRLNRGPVDVQPSASFTGSKRRLSAASASEDSVLKPEPAKLVHESESGFDFESTEEDFSSQLSEEDDTDETASDTGNHYKYSKNNIELTNQISCLPLSDRRPPFSARSVFRARPRLFGFRGSRTDMPALRPMRMPRMPRIPRMPRPMFRGGPPMRFWGGRY